MRVFLRSHLLDNPALHGHPSPGTLLSLRFSSNAQQGLAVVIAFDPDKTRG